MKILANSSYPSHAVPWDYETPPRFEPYSFEKIDYPKWKHFMALYWKLPVYTSVLYVVIIFTLQFYMRNKEPFRLRRLLFLWNVSLGAFSLLGFSRTIQEFLNVLLSPNGTYRSLCIREGLNEPFAYWSVAFAFSKYIELGDTVFIVLKKQPLILLQWYHHCTAMMLAWIVIPYSEPISRYYGLMNFGVHSLMYPYFALKTIRVKIPRSISKCLTFLQLLQMIIAVAANAYTNFAVHSGIPCARDNASINWSWAVYGTYVFLFGRLYYKNYFAKKTKHF